MLNNTSVVELVVYNDEDYGNYDSYDADNDHRNVQSHGHCLYISLDDCSVL